MWSENVILADAGYLDKVAFRLTVNFERMLERRIPPADMARWAECAALDGGLRPGEGNVQVVLLHSEESRRMECFRPAAFADELDGKAFNGPLGEFTFSSLPAPADLVSPGSLFSDSLVHILADKEVRRVMLVPDGEAYLDEAMHTLKRLDLGERQMTLFTMEPVPGLRGVRLEMLGYSIMAALGIDGSEIEKKSAGM